MNHAAQSFSDAAKWVLGPLVWAALSFPVLADDLAESAADPLPVLQFANHDFASGHLADSQGAGELAWQSPAFVEPLRVPLTSISAVQFPTPGKLPTVNGDYAFELAGGDLLFGSLVSLSRDEALIDVPGTGKLHIARAVLRRLSRWQGSELLFNGPTSLDGWKLQPDAKAWREEAGKLVTTTEGATLRRDLALPARAVIEFELSWASKGDFELVLGAPADPKKSADRAFRFDVWNGQLVACRETEKEADVVALDQLKPGPEQLHLKAYLDQLAGRMLVYSATGRPLADLNVATAKPQALGAIFLRNRGGHLRLEMLRVSRWNGRPPAAADGERARLHQSDGKVVQGEVESFDPQSREFVLAPGEPEDRFPAAKTQDIFFEATTKPQPRSISAVLLSGVRVSGELLKVEKDRVWLRSPGIREPVAIPLNSLRGLNVLGESQRSVETKGRWGRLEAEGLSLHGALVEGRFGSKAGLVWQITSSTAGSALVPTLAGRVIYREPPPPRPTTTAYNGNARVQVRVAQGGGNIFQRMFNLGEPPDKLPPRHEQPLLHLVSGDVIACRVTSIDEQGVTFTSEATDATFVPHDRIQVIELTSDIPGGTILKSKKERLLTLPRIQRDNPPTQLIRSVQGDYLRGRLLSLDDKQAEVEIRAENRTIPRETIARILWLHKSEAPAKQPPAEQPEGMRVQSLPRDGHRLTFFAQQLSGSTLSGRSDVLGPCRVDLDQIDQLLIGPAIELAASELAFHQWQLKAAAEPLAARDGDSGDGSEGFESPLVGKPAPDIELDLLDGKKFRLAEHKNKVLVLDFWASWCGPCLQVMPLVEKVAGEFPAVELVSVNQEETPDRVKAVLSRLKLTLAVALDREGRVGERYGATSIPQTVIIGADGNVARVFVGGSATFDEQLRKALREVIEGKGEQPEPKPN